MTDNPQNRLRDIDQAILQQIQDGNNDTHQITQALTLETHQVRYSLKKLENLGLIDLEKPDGMVEREINGQKRVFQHPTQAGLTEKAEYTLNRLQETESDIERLNDLSHRELVGKVRELEEEMEQMQQKFTVFRKQVQRKLD